jgi:hypothetical protein
LVQKPAWLVERTGFELAIPSSTSIAKSRLELPLVAAEGSTMRLQPMFFLMIPLFVGANGLAGAAGQPAYEYNSEVPASWYFLLYDRVKAENLSPPVAADAHARRPLKLAPVGKLETGAMLIREWGGVKHQVTVLENGFSFRGQRYQSLSAVARARSTPGTTFLRNGIGSPPAACNGKRVPESASARSRKDRAQ